MITRRYVGKREEKITAEYEKLVSLCFVNEFPKMFAHNYTASFRSILRVLSPFSFLEFINVFPHTALFSLLTSRFPTSDCAPWQRLSHLQNLSDISIEIGIKNHRIKT